MKTSLKILVLMAMVYLASFSLSIGIAYAFYAFDTTEKSRTLWQ